jgi:PTH1 family peptidyl-tRNA hydrolase
LKLVVGLGNRGARYEGTRHNVGFRVVEAFGARCGAAFTPRFAGRFAQVRFEGAPVGLLLPDTFMNASGRSVGAAVEALAPEALLVVLDDIDLPLGRLRLRPGGSDGGQRGLRDVMACVEGEVPRLRVGVGRPPLGTVPIDHVLARFEASEQEAAHAATERAADAISRFLCEGVERAMAWANAPPPAEAVETAKPQERTGERRDTVSRS